MIDPADRDGPARDRVRVDHHHHLGAARVRNQDVAVVAVAEFAAAEAQRDAAAQAAVLAPRAHVSPRAVRRRDPDVRAVFHADLTAAAPTVRRNVHALGRGLGHAPEVVPGDALEGAPAADDPHRAGDAPAPPFPYLSPAPAEPAPLARPVRRLARPNLFPRGRLSSPAAATSNPWYVVSLRFCL